MMFVGSNSCSRVSLPSSPKFAWFCLAVRPNMPPTFRDNEWMTFFKTNYVHAYILSYKYELYYISLKGPTGIHSHIRKGWWFGGFCYILLRWLWRTSCATRGRTCLRPWSTSRDAGAGACASIRPFGWHLDWTWRNFTSIYSKCQYTIIIIIVPSGELT